MDKDLEDAADKAQYLRDLRVKFLAALEKEHSCSAPAKDDIPSARDQLVALWTSWIEAKNDEDGTGCQGGGGGDDHEDAEPEGAPSGRAPTPPPLNCCT